MHISPNRFRRSQPPPEAKPRPIISAPMNPRLLEFPIISAPLNPRPFGLPDPNTGAGRGLPEPVGPNAYRELAERHPGDRDRYSPNYPVEYHYPFPLDGSRGLPTIATGPSLLPPGRRVEGPVDYASIPDLVLAPDRRLSGEAPLLGPEQSSSVGRYLAGGAPPDAAGGPTLPKRAFAFPPPGLPPTPENPFGLPGPATGPDLHRDVLGGTRPGE